MKSMLILCSALIYLCSGCESFYEGKLPESEPMPVLNGVLYADSVLALNLTWSNQPNVDEFEPISGASFVLKKNGLLISSKYKYNNQGRYVFEDTCKNDDKYDIEVLVTDLPKLTSQTTIPNKPTVSLTKTNQLPSDIFKLDVVNMGKEIHAFYILLFLYEPTDNGKSTWEQIRLYCDSPFADPFNRFYDSWAPKGFLYEYEQFVRFPTDNLTNGRLQTNLTFIGNSEYIRFYVIAATKEYDLYYKGGYLQRSFNPEVNLPFTYQPIFLPTNISGGAGIFSGIDISLVEFKD
jgi:hypothetical protein